MDNPLPFLIVDAFENGPFTGNPAGVCFLSEPVEDCWLQDVAMEINQAETAFLLPKDDGYSLRWFTPTLEVDLCGHATLAAAHALWETARLDWAQVANFYTKSGKLTAVWDSGLIRLDFPGEPPSAVTADPNAIGVPFLFAGQNRMDWFFELADEEAVVSFLPDFAALAELGMRGVILTARSSNSDHDFVSRFFAPASGIDEDPVTGSAHCALAPFWADRLGKKSVTGYQASKRGGLVRASVVGERVLLGGTAKTIVNGLLTAG